MGCARPDPRGIVLENGSASQQQDPSRTWTKYREFLGGVADGAKCDEYQLAQAVRFFEDLTKIRSGLEMSALGLILDRPKLQEALAKWDEWYSRHGASIRWDPNTHRYTADSS